MATVPGGATRDRADASPTKKFFVSMLTRDISLVDAILDLIDNSLDGALRLAGGKSEEVDYSKHVVDVKLNGEYFSITDNCGGISREVAKHYAFKMGRDPEDRRDLDAETIGMYGVGMKRAIFKMGRKARVDTRHSDDAFRVEISSEWLESPEWDPLPISALSDVDFPEPGTTIVVEDLYPGVSKHFANAAFLNDLRNSVSEHFTLFLQRGLLIKINGERIKPVRVEVLMDDNETGPAPFVYQGTIDGVLVTIAVGLNTGEDVPDEDDVPEFERDRSARIAGWTVLCNDRAVIVGDKSRLTGWGDGIPLYHYQFSIITGIVEFKSPDAEKLPVTTTKRALDASSHIWLETLAKMRQAMRIWINYTNKWKNHPRSDQTPFWKNAKAVSLAEAVEKIRTRTGAVKTDGHIEYNPMKKKVLPFPKESKPTSRRIVFSRPINEIKLLAEELFDDPDTKPGIVGDRCFQLVLNKVKNREGL